MSAFPNNFLWGAATASYQIEGAVFENGKGESIWDRFSHTPGKVQNGDTGDTACDHYHRYKEDITLMKQIGLQAYRFSISWPRIFPEGKGSKNPKGIDFYQRLVDGLLEADIKPTATLYHWDLPQKLQDIGGWENRDCAYYFRDYAGTMFNALGDRVHAWISHNEPMVAALIGHQLGVHAPGKKDTAAALQVAHHLNLSHGLSCTEFGKMKKAGDMIGITINISPVHPATDSEADREAARLQDGMNNRWFLDPVLKGSYPEDAAAAYRKAGAEPDIQDGDWDIITSYPVDFLGINYYTRHIVKRGENPPFGIKQVKADNAEFTEMGWEIYPEGLYETLKNVQNEYDPPLIFITENGAAVDDKPENGSRVADKKRRDYLAAHFEQARRAIEDGVKLGGYFVWSLLDNFEWAFGYSKRFGIIYIDYETQERTVKDSARWYSEVIARNGL